MDTQPSRKPKSNQNRARKSTHKSHQEKEDHDRDLDLSTSGDTSSQAGSVYHGRLLSQMEKEIRLEQTALEGLVFLSAQASPGAPGRARKKGQGIVPGVKNQTSGEADEGLGDVIQMLRRSLKTLMDFSYEITTHDQAIVILDALGRNATRLARLLEAEKRLNEGQEEYEQALTDAQDEVQQELQAEATARTAAIEQAWKENHYGYS